LDEKINLPQVDVTQIDGDLFADGLGNRGEDGSTRRHDYILKPSMWMVHGCFTLIDVACAIARSRYRVGIVDDIDIIAAATFRCL
jgi:hypothetical protein